MSVERELLVTLFAEIHHLVAESAALAKASEGCARDGYIDKAFTIALDIDQLLFDANSLLQATSVITRRIIREGET